MALEIDCRDLPNRVSTSFTSVGSSADSPELLLRPSPATDHDAEKLEVSDPDLGYYAENFPSKQSQGGMRPTCRAGLFRGLCGNNSNYSIVGQEERLEFIPSNL
jgi:hypothetical protein